MPSFVNHFEGTASFYARHRPGYPDALFDLLCEEARLNASSSVLDLGCGTGQVAVPLAPRVGAITGVDPDSGMLAEATSVAELAQVTNATWIACTAEAFAGAPDRYDLVVIASAFHWMDRPAVAGKSHQLLRDGGLLAIAANPTPLTQIRRRQGVGRAIAEVQDRWFGQIGNPLSDHSVIGPEDVIRASPFGAATVQRIPCQQRWDVESLVGFLRSTSWRPDQRLGIRFSDFAAEIDDAIRSVEPTGEWTFYSEVEVTLARR